MDHNHDHINGGVLVKRTNGSPQDRFASQISILLRHAVTGPMATPGSNDQCGGLWMRHVGYVSRLAIQMPTL